MAGFLRPSDLLRGFMGRHGSKIRGAEALAAYGHAVGEKVAKVSEAYAFTDGLLRVRVEDGVWRQELSLSENRLLDKIAARLGDRRVERIRFDQGRLRGPKDDTPTLSSVRKAMDALPDPEPVKVSGLADHALAASFERLFAHMRKGQTLIATRPELFASPPRAPLPKREEADADLVFPRRGHRSAFLDFDD